MRGVRACGEQHLVPDHWADSSGRISEPLTEGRSTCGERHQTLSGVEWTCRPSYLRKTTGTSEEAEQQLIPG